jgi:hypothetical protein
MSSYMKGEKPLVENHNYCALCLPADSAWVHAGRVDKIGREAIVAPSMRGLAETGIASEPTTKKKVFQGGVHDCETQRFRKQYGKIKGHY